MNLKIINYKSLSCAILLGVAGGCASPRQANDLSRIESPVSMSIFDGESIEGWKLFVKSEYEELGGPVEVRDGAIRMKYGQPYSAVLWDGIFPKNNYEVEVSAMRTDGNDIFCGLLFPVGTNYCTLILGGWGNSITGLSCVDYMTAADNSTAVMKKYEPNTWYDVRLRVTDEKIEAWVDTEKMIDLDLQDRRISPYFGLEIFKPFGIFTYQTDAAFKEIYIKRVEKEK